MGENKINTDFYKFYLSSKRLLEGKSPYWGSPESLDKNSHCYKGELSTSAVHFKQSEAFSQLQLPAKLCLNANLNSPVFVALFAPLASLPLDVVWWLWQGLSMLCLVLSLLCITRSNVFGVYPWSSAFALLVGVLVYYPTRANLMLGQVTFFMMLIVIAAWISLRSGREVWSGSLLGFAASVKPFLGLFIITLIVGRKWGAATAFSVTSLICMILSLVVTGVAGWQDYLGALSEVDWVAVNWNASITGYFFRLFGGGPGPSWLDAPTLAQVFVPFFCFLVLASLLYSIDNVRKTWRKDNETVADIVFATTLPSMLLISPLGWLYYFPILIPPMLWAIRVNQFTTDSRVIGLLIVLFLVLSGLPKVLLSAVHADGALSWLWHFSQSFYALSLFYIVMLIVARRYILALARHKPE